MEDHRIGFGGGTDERITDKFEDSVGFFFEAGRGDDFAAKNLDGVFARDLSRLMSAHTVAHDEQYGVAAPNADAAETVLIDLPTHADVAFSAKIHVWIPFKGSDFLIKIYGIAVAIIPFPRRAAVRRRRRCPTRVCGVPSP